MGGACKVGVVTQNFGVVRRVVFTLHAHTNKNPPSLNPGSASVEDGETGPPLKQHRPQPVATCSSHYVRL